MNILKKSVILFFSQKLHVQRSWENVDWRTEHSTRLDLWLLRLDSFGFFIFNFLFVNAYGD